MTPHRPQRDHGGLPRALTHPTAATEYEQTISIPAARAGMNETDWIVHRAMTAAYNHAGKAHHNAEAEAA